MRQMIANTRSVLVALFLCMLLPTLSAAAELTFETAPLTIVTVNGQRHDVIAELALDSAQREQGLMNRREMAQDRAMLFDFGAPRRVMMWMKNTYLPLDMLFIDTQGTVKTIRERAEPLSEAIIDSRVPVAYVLELNAGTVSRLRITPGARIETARIPASSK